MEKLNSAEQNITLVCQQHSHLVSTLTLTNSEVTFIESAITELYIRTKASNPSRKLIQKMCIKINDWRNAIINNSITTDCTVNSQELRHIRKGIDTFMSTLPLTCSSERTYSHEMLLKLNLGSQACCMAA